MKRHGWTGALLLTLIAGGLAPAAEPPTGEPDRPCFVQRLQPAGGWDPYGGGLLHWWNPHCFPCCSGPDDYCRKTLPCVCWPPYPSYYLWGLPPAPNAGAGPRP